VRRAAATVLSAALAGVLAGCGGAPRSGAAKDACAGSRARLSSIQRVVTLADAGPAVRRSLVLDRAGLAAARRTLGSSDPLTLRFETAIGTASRFLAAARDADPQQTMSPLRTSVPGARRIVETTRQLYRALCAG
jgi:hypothetical protein